MNQDEMRKAIMFERRVEFAFEGKRYWDLRRRRLFEDLLNGIRHGYTVQLKVSEAQWNQVKNSKSSEEMLNLLDQHYTDYFKHDVKLLDNQFDINWKPEYYFFAIPSEHL